MENYSSKKSMSINQRVALLESRNLIVSNQSEFKEYLSNINTYYHVTGYRFLLSKYDKSSDNYNGHTSNELIAYSELDKEIYMILMPYLRKIEQGLRARVSNLCYENDMLSFLIDFKHQDLIIKDNYWSCLGNSGLFLSPTLFKNYSKDLFKDLRKNINEPAISHYIKEHDGIIPIWVIVNFLTFGNLISVIDCFSSVKLDQFTNNLPYRKSKNETDPRRQDLLSIRMLRNKISHFSMLLGKNSPYSYNQSILELGISSISKISRFLFNEHNDFEIIEKIENAIEEINKEYRTSIESTIINKIAITYSLQKKKS